MASSTRTIDILLKEVADPGLRTRLTEQINVLRNQTKFGLVFEGHHPEVSRLPDAAVRRGAVVARRNEKGNALYRVESIKAGKAVCLPEEPAEHAQEDLFAKSETLPLADLVVARRFGDPIYPSLRLIDSIGRASQKPWHVLIEADNYHALQTLGYTHTNKVDVIYIDPPYNTGARDWRYNNDYVDQNDPWRHSKWLSFIEKRLRLARKLLKPDGVLIVTVDEHELYHLGCLLEQLFPGARIQPISICINPSGASGNGLSRVGEYAFFLFFGTAQPARVPDDGLTTAPASGRIISGWESLLRRGSSWTRQSRKNLCYPVLLDPATHKIVGAGPPFSGDDESKRPLKIDGKLAAWPVRKDLSLGIWRVDGARLTWLSERGFAYCTKFDAKRNTWAFRYLMEGTVDAIQAGKLQVIGRGEHGEAIVNFSRTAGAVPKTIWVRGKHNAGGSGGTQLLATILGARGGFTYPKSIYAVEDCIRAACGDRRDSVILDFFGGSGTTLNAVALMNAKDGGQRQCILVTNNEVSEDTRSQLLKSKLQEGDDQWEDQGICRAVSWPRCKTAITGKRGDGKPLAASYSTGEMEETETEPSFVQLGLAEGTELTLSQRKDIVRLIDGLALGTVTAEDPWQIQEDAKISILWDIRAADKWIEALVDAGGCHKAYVVSKDKKAFKALLEDLKESLPPLMKLTEKRRPMDLGFEENVAYFRLGFLEPGDVARGQQFQAILPMLWMLAGSKGRSPTSAKIARWLIAPESGLAVLHREEHFDTFLAELHPLISAINHVFLVTDSEDAFKEMRQSLPRAMPSTMLYSSYLRNFAINAGPTP